MVFACAFFVPIAYGVVRAELSAICNSISALVKEREISLYSNTIVISCTDILKGGVLHLLKNLVNFLSPYPFDISNLRV